MTNVDILPLPISIFFYSHIINVPFLIIYNNHVVFGRFVEGIDVMKKIEQLSTTDWVRPIALVNISNCGEFFPGKDNGRVALDEGIFIF